ncbi:MAG: HAMP domain-containing histidine kinase [Actinomycetales bacterium]|nr:HAMP domain-containing histidine kinase [Actinomycetales bacterium]
MASLSESLDRRWNGISLRAKITGITVLLLTFGLVVTGVSTMSVLRGYLLERVDESLTGIALPSVVQLDDISGFGDPRLGFRYYIAAVSADGTLLEDNLSDEFDALRPDVSELTLANVIQQSGGITLSNETRTTEWRVVAYPLQIGNGSQQATLVIGVSLRDTNATITRFALIFFAFSLVVIVFGAATTQLLVTSTFGPLRDVEETAARFAAGDYAQRLGGATPNTEVGRLNRSLNTMLARIDRAFAERQRAVDQMRRFVGDASHELRTPLVSVRGYAELYRMGALQNPDDVAGAMDRIEREAIRMTALVEDLLELARLDEDRPLELAPLDLLPLARDAAMDASASAPAREVRVVVVEHDPSEPEPEEAPVLAPLSAGRTGAATRRAERAARRAALQSERAARATAADAPRAGGPLGMLLRRRPAPSATPAADRSTPLPAVGPIVLAEENKIRQVIANLMGNAMRFTPDDSPLELEVGVDRLGGYGQISIVDHGEGIPPQLREKIFQRFYRADTSRTRDTGGSGLGLAIVAGIVQNHRGHVEVLATPGGGATFRVSLPLAPVADGGAAADEAPGDEAPADGTRAESTATDAAERA